MSLVAKLSLHTQQICGLAWSPDGQLFASGGNDNLCCLFAVGEILGERGEAVGDENASTTLSSRLGRTFSVLSLDTSDADLEREQDAGSTGTIWHDGDSLGARTIRRSPEGIRRLGPSCARYRWVHGAAVKAIAFCPWRDGLVATGGGLSDKCIHFFHTTSGSALATIAVLAQVTSLIWSTTRREIAATFGYTQPDHPYRIAIFSWPECRQVAAIPWEGELRALYAIPYPGGPTGGRRARGGGTAQEGCIVVASSDKSVKFHEVWSDGTKATAGGTGMLGGSDILEGLEGIDKEGDIIR